MLMLIIMINSNWDYNNYYDNNYVLYCIDLFIENKYFHLVNDNQGI